MTVGDGADLLAALVSRGADVEQLRGLDVRALDVALRNLGVSKMGHRMAVRSLLGDGGEHPDGEGGGEGGGSLLAACEVVIVCTHHHDDLAWMIDVLRRHQLVGIVIYDTAVEPLLPAGLASHPRVEVRDKAGALAAAPFFFSVFDYIERAYDLLPPHILFLHGHERAWHQSLAVGELLRLCGRALAADASLEYASLNDQVMPDWVTPGRLDWSTPDGGTSPSMISRVANQWAALSPLLGEGVAPPPRVLCEVHGAQALVARCRALARPRASWARLREFARGIRFHSEADYALEGCFHRIFGEPWERPFVREHLAALLKGQTSELRIRAAAPGAAQGVGPAAFVAAAAAPAAEVAGEEEEADAAAADEDEAAAAAAA